MPAAYGGTCDSPRTVESNLSGDAAMPAAAAARLYRWLPASVAPKFIRASMAPLENHDGPRSHPDTSGGSNRFCPMFDKGVSASFTEKPLHPKSFSARTTNSTGHEYRA